jgi:glucokinase
VTRIVVGDIGGTHARFAIADLTPGQAPAIGPMKRYRTRDYPGLAAAWARFEGESGEPLPRYAALAVAAPIEGEILRFMNSDWRIERRTLGADLGLERLLLLNDFGAVAHAVSILAPESFAPICGPETLLEDGVMTVMGAGTGLGVAALIRRGGAVTVLETEAAHVAFAPLDPEEEELSDTIVGRYGRASIERVVSGPGLIDIYTHLGGEISVAPNRAGDLWSAAIDGADTLAARALAILVRCFGAVAGDLALAHGATGVVVTGGLANRILPLLRSPVFAERFAAKGRYRERMQRTPVMLATEAEPGLLGAAVAFGREFGV